MKLFRRVAIALLAVVVVAYVAVLGYIYFNQRALQYTATGEITALADEGDSKRVTLAAGPEIAPYVAAKGSITLDGISLTVNSVEDKGGRVAIGVNLIPHTAQVTTFDALEVGRAVNIEIDVLARYLQRLETYRAKA